ncbi:hypothetical protein IMG5_104820 [Ichthyophthirius multifiliis]|uniref:Transmembrane protein n=1 Tax=Ichthyophthirius multifiliis TaxID=5932 RepID=G0QSY9_ICHMU|nr:hypothetical protein IMG5_104820 [Ichthyophthirius multifiliis]EGR31660.1 hypothetical protein IMG5_104820 [Ichthyophthirius multifiliis]|eukprot:XP_004035146.1 hypothetical protein IMG5_104820 [Ichthyophthirius multifiliis]
MKFSSRLLSKKRKNRKKDIGQFKLISEILIMIIIFLLKFHKKSLGLKKLKLQQDIQIVASFHQIFIMIKKKKKKNKLNLFIQEKHLLFYQVKKSIDQEQIHIQNLQINIM